ncbi:MAG: preprotein translocase subunit YajC [Alphaproteobacteria bacterium]|nr:preprotein translocase subunit YajC [Alphaproteobacteria bacterium]
MFVSPAYAQAAAEGSGDFGMIQLLPLVLIFVVFYFLLIRPQQKKAKAHRELVANLRRGDNVLTSGGIIGRVTKVLEENRVMVEIADGVRVQIAASSVSDVLSRGEPAPAEASNKKGKAGDGDAAKKQA